MSRVAAAAATAAGAAEFARAAAPREFELGAREFDRIVARLRAEAGIDMPRAKEPLVYSRLAKRIRALGLAGFRDYCALLEDPDSDEVGHMLAALTTNVTRFFREPHHFEDLARAMLPGLIERARAGGRVRLWSAGCSSGQEPYSMALTVLQAAPEAPRLDLKILASDISDKVLAEARRGVYPEEALRDAPAELRRRHFRAAPGGGLVAGEELRALISFRRLNLMGEWPMRGRFDVVFCRNVAIYFDEPTQARLWRRVAERMAPGGRLYIGHSERIDGPALELLRSDGVTAYRRVGAAS